MGAESYTRSEPPGLLERAGVSYYRRLARHAEIGVAGRPHLHQLPPDSTLSYLSLDIVGFAVMVTFAHVLPEHIQELRDRWLTWINKVRVAVKDHLTKEIAYWDHRADGLQTRLQRRLAELDREVQVSALPSFVVGALVVAPLGLIAAMTGQPIPTSPVDTQAAARALGYEPVDRELETLGYDMRKPHTRQRSPALYRSQGPDDRGRHGDGDQE